MDPVVRNRKETFKVYYFLPAYLCLCKKFPRVLIDEASNWSHNQKLCGAK